MKTSLRIAMMALLFLAMPQQAKADLWNGGGFEGSLGWTGTDTFMSESATEGAAPNAARFFDFIDDDMVTESGVWIEDSTRAYEGDRMYWLRNYADPDTICAGHRFTGLTTGAEYRLNWQFAAFDPTNSTGSTTLTSKPVIEVMSWDTTTSDWVVSEPVLHFGDGQTSDFDAGNVAEYEVQDWNNLNWISASTQFAAPEANGRPIYIWVSMTNDSNGMLIDGITFTAVPEPAAALFAGLACLGLVGRRNRRD